MNEVEKEKKNTTTEERYMPTQLSLKRSEKPKKRKATYYNIVFQSDDPRR